jgi:hypothetical protein
MPPLDSFIDLHKKYQEYSIFPPAYRLDEGLDQVKALHTKRNARTVHDVGSGGHEQQLQTSLFKRGIDSD